MTILVDTSFLFALVNRNDADHDACAGVARNTREHIIIPVSVLPEAAYLIGRRLGHSAMRQVVRQLLDSTWAIEPLLQTDLERSHALLEQYSDARLDFVDATVIAMAERLNVSTLLTLDRRDFGIVRPRHCQAFQLLPH